jgi:hypothetical protein
MGITAILPDQVLADGASDGDLLTVQADGSVAFETPAGGGIGGTTGSTDDAILRADGTGGSTLQSSGVTIDDTNNLTASKLSAVNFVQTNWGWFYRGTSAIMALDPSQMRMNNKPIVGLTELAFGANGTLLSREADDHIQQRRGTNPQTISVANTYTSATSYERLDIGWNANVCTIQTTAGSAGGTKRGLQIGGASIDELGFFGATPVDQPATVADPSGGSTVDTEARAAIAAVIDRLQELGLIA